MPSKQGNVLHQTCHYLHRHKLITRREALELSMLALRLNNDCFRDEHAKRAYHFIGLMKAHAKSN